MQPLLCEAATRKRIGCYFHTDAPGALGVNPLQTSTLAPPPLSPWLSCIDRRSTYNLIFYLLISLPSPPHPQPRLLPVRGADGGINGNLV